LSAHFLRNLYNNLGSTNQSHEKVYYISIKGGDKDIDFKIEHVDGNKFDITDVQSGAKTTHEVKDFDLEYGALLRFNDNGQKRLVQFLTTRGNLYFDFYN
jgi:hypothetical protein